MLKVCDLWKTYDMGESRLEILRGLNLEVRAGEFVSILGASGTGKSTLLHLLGGLDHPDRGTIEIGGKPFVENDEGDLALRRNQQIGFVFQFHHLLPEFTALENVAIPSKIAGTSDSLAKSEAEKRLQEVGLGQRMHHIPSRLSGGERQRVAVARSLVNSPDLLLMDEPTGNLDPKAGDALFDMLTRIQQEKQLTVVMVTHNLELAARTDRRVVMRDGQLEEID